MGNGAQLMEQPSPTLSLWGKQEEGSKTLLWRQRDTSQGWIDGDAKWPQTWCLAVLWSWDRFTTISLQLSSKNEADLCGITPEHQKGWCSIFLWPKVYSLFRCMRSMLEEPFTCRWILKAVCREGMHRGCSICGCWQAQVQQLPAAGRFLPKGSSSAFSELPGSFSSCHWCQMMPESPMPYPKLW